MASDAMVFDVPELAGRGEILPAGKLSGLSFIYYICPVFSTMIKIIK